MEKLKIFTDGGSLPTDEKKENFNSASSFVAYKDYELLTSESNYHPLHTHNYAEIFAIKRGLEFVEAFFENKNQNHYILEIYSDSMLYVNSLNIWIHSWLKNIKNGQIYRSGNQPVINQESILSAHKIFSKLQCEKHIYHINSHIASNQLKATYAKFIKFNKCNIDFDEFVFATLKNNECDKYVTEAMRKGNSG